MPTFKALYYPSWDPPVKWLRSMLLFFDRIEVIKPTDVDPKYNPANAAVFDLIPHVFGEIKRERYQTNLSVRNKRILEKNFKLIAESNIRRQRILNVILPPEGGMGFTGYTYLHTSKLDPYILQLLKDNSLINNAAEDIRDDLEGYRIVEENASGLVLSLIADYYAKQKTLRTITDKPIGYVVNALNTNPMMRREAAAMSLATSILHVEIPDNIERLTPDQYVNLRDRYEDIREPFQHAVRTLCDDYQLAQIIRRRQFEEAVHDAMRDFCLESEGVRRGDWSKRIKKWSFMGLSVLTSCCGLKKGGVVKLGKYVSAGLHVHKSLQGTGYTTEKRHAQQLLGNLKDEMAHSLLLRRIGKS